MAVDRRQSCAVAHLRGSKHKIYEDSFRLLPREIDLVESCNRGELFAVFDGIGSAQEGRHAAQYMADLLIEFYRYPNKHQASWEGIQSLLLKGNMNINKWGFKPGTDIPLGGCAGTIIWVIEETLYVFHAGDTSAVLIRDKNAIELTQPHQLPDGAIFRYFGLGSNLKLYVNSFKIDEFDRVLIMSDGVTKVFHPLDAAKIVTGHQDIALAVKTLAEISKALGSTDDITALLVQIEEIWK
jgi:serine/threonine protein phosphatase PrpC